jgi:hypothetical protein
MLVLRLIAVRFVTYHLDYTNIALQFGFVIFTVEFDFF